MKSIRSNVMCQGVRRGTVYIAVLAMAMIVAVIGISTLTLSRVQARSTANESDWAEAGMLAFSAVEHAVKVLNEEFDTWRGSYPHNGSPNARGMGRGTLSWYLVDEIDADVNNNPEDPVRVYATGQVGSTKRKLSVLLQPGPILLPALQRPIHCDDDFRIKFSDVDESVARATQISSANTVITVNGGALSTNDNLELGGVIFGDVEANTMTGSGVIEGETTVPAPLKYKPGDQIFEIYFARATEIPFPAASGGSFEPGLLNSTTNPYGATNPEAVYHITVPISSTLTIDKSRLIATLLVTLSLNADLVVQGEVLWEPHRPDYPILIVSSASASGTRTVTLNSSPAGVSESVLNLNLNPPGSPYDDDLYDENTTGETDNDKIDIYPAEFRGLVHANGTNTRIMLGTNVVSKGCILGGERIEIGTNAGVSNAELSTNPIMFTFPTIGYTYGDTIRPVPETWRWEVSP